MGNAENVHLHLPPPLSQHQSFPFNLVDLCTKFPFLSRLDKSTLNCRLAIGQPFTSATEASPPNGRTSSAFHSGPRGLADTTATGHCTCGINEPGSKRRIWSPRSWNHRQLPVLAQCLGPLLDCLAIAPTKAPAFLRPTTPVASQLLLSQTCPFPPSPRCSLTTTSRRPRRSNCLFPSVGPIPRPPGPNISRCARHLAPRRRRRSRTRRSPSAT